MILSSRGRRGAGGNRIASDASEFCFHLTQLPQQLIELGGPAQLLVLVDLGKYDSARLCKRDDVRGIESTHASVFPAELYDYALKPILLRLPLPQRMRLQQVIDSPRFGRRTTHGNSRGVGVTKRFTLD